MATISLDSTWEDKHDKVINTSDSENGVALIVSVIASSQAMRRLCRIFFLELGSLAVVSPDQRNKYFA